MASTIFWAWQDKLPRATNRNLIGRALEDAARKIHNDGSIAVDPAVVRDTSGEPGSPDVAATIFARIEVCDVFVCDVSLIDGVPNPNVLIELGYAIRARGWPRIVMVFNAAFGDVENLPFDLRGKRVLKYEAREEDAERVLVRRELEGTLRLACETIFREVPPDDRAAPTPTGTSLAAGKLLEAELDTYAELWRKLTAVVDAARSVRPMMDFAPPSGQTHEQRLAERCQHLAATHNEFLRYYQDRELYYPAELAGLFDEVGRTVRMEIFSCHDAGHRDPEFWRVARANLAAIEQAAVAAHRAIRARLETLRGDDVPTSTR